MQVDDVNDNSPLFIYPNKNYTTHEIWAFNIKPGETVMQICAIDLDSGHNSEVAYKLRSLNNNKNVNSLFELSEKTGELKATRYPTEDDLGSFEWEISAQDNSPQAKNRKSTNIWIRFNITGPLRSTQEFGSFSESNKKTSNRKDGSDTNTGLFGGSDIFYTVVAFTIGAFACIIIILILIILIRYRSCVTPANHLTPHSGISEHFL